MIQFHLHILITDVHTGHITAVSNCQSLNVQYVIQTTTKYTMSNFKLHVESKLMRNAKDSLGSARDFILRIKGNLTR